MTGRNMSVFATQETRRHMLIALRFEKVVQPCREMAGHIGCEGYKTCARIRMRKPRHCGKQWPF